jgi:hypothetical protein
MIFEKDFIDFIDLLNRFKIDYMVVGAHALAFHGKPRHTGDLDIWIKPSSDNANKMVLVLKEFGFGSLALSPSDFLKENYVTQLGYPPLRIDILNSISGVSFDEALANSLTTKVDDLDIIYIGLLELIQNKVATGRKQDLADIESLEKLKKKN